MIQDSKQFVGDACDLYFKYKHKHQTDDWEQEYFDAMSARYDTDTEQCLIHLFYPDDDTIGSTAQGILDDLTGKTLLYATCFDDYESDTTVAVYITTK